MHDLLFCTDKLTYEKYKGDALLQKHYTVDYLTKKQKKDLLIEKNNNLIMQNSTKTIEQELYKKKENAIMVPYNKVEKELSDIESKIKEKNDRCIILDDYIKNLKGATKITDFDEGLFCALVENVIVYKNDIKIRWKGEMEP